MEGVPFIECRAVLWRLIPFALIWSVWKERNDNIFRGASISVDDLCHLVTLRIAKWASSTSDFDNLRMEGISHNWEATLSCQVPKVGKVVLWSPLVGVLKFNVDNARKRKAGPLGIVRVLQNSDGNVMAMFSKYVGNMESN